MDQKQPHLCVMIQFAVAGLPKFKEGDTDLFGMAGFGTFAESIVVPQEGAVKIDDDVPFDIASLIGCGVTTGVGAAINTAKVTPGSTCVVIGCGGVGISVIQGCRIAGASVIVAVDLNDEKLETAKRFGATHGVKPDDLAALQAEVTGAAGGFDFAFEAIGFPQTVRAAYDHGPLRASSPSSVSAGSTSWWSSTCSSCSSTRRRSTARTTARPMSARTSTGCCACGRRALFLPIWRA